MSTSSDDQTIARYLLGVLPSEERRQLEERLFTDDLLHEQCEAAADDLIHAYLRDALPPQERARFESHFLASPRRRERLDFVRDLVTVVGRITPQAVAPELPPAPILQRAPSRWRPWVPAASLLLASAAFIAALLLAPPRRPPEPSLASPQPSLALSPPLPPGKAPVEAVQSAPREESVRMVRLPHAPPARPTEVRLSAAARIVRLEVAVEDGGPPSYDAIVRKADGSEAWRAEGLAPSRPGEPLVVPIPATIFSSADYVLIVEGEALRTGAQEAAHLVEYRLRIVREP